MQLGDHPSRCKHLRIVTLMMFIKQLLHCCCKWHAQPAPTANSQMKLERMSLASLQETMLRDGVTQASGVQQTTSTMHVQWVFDTLSKYSKIAVALIQLACKPIAGCQLSALD